MAVSYSGRVLIAASQLNLDLTLMGGQSFRWRRRLDKHGKGTAPVWSGVAYDAYWQLSQDSDGINYEVTALPATLETKDAGFFNELLSRYFRLDFDLPGHIEKWSAAHKHFARISKNMSSVRILDQEVFENIISFLCSQNNNIKRISTMVQSFCASFGRKIGCFDGVDEFAFPTCAELLTHTDHLESHLRAHKFGYRARFIAQSVQHIVAHGGVEWLNKLKAAPYPEARQLLVTLPGVGHKVADCVCLMSLGHLKAVPVDVHIYKIALKEYLPHLKPNSNRLNVTTYDLITGHFQEVYGPSAGWAQAVLFCSSLQQFKANAAELVDNDNCHLPQKKSRGNYNTPA